MPFRLTNTPTTFMSVMNVYKEYLDIFVIIFVDILVYSKSIEIHRGHLRLVLHTLKRHQLFVKISKCNF